MGGRIDTGPHSLWQTRRQRVIVNHYVYRYYLSQRQCRFALRIGERLDRLPAGRATAGDALWERSQKECNH